MVIPFNRPIRGTLKYSNMFLGNAKDEKQHLRHSELIALINESY